MVKIHPSGATHHSFTYKVGLYISQYADDTCMYVNDLESLKVIFHLLDLLTKGSGLKVNRDKSEAMGIGASSNYRHPVLGVKWPKDPVKCLGIF
jgi:hypothetical protein